DKMRNARLLEEETMQVILHHAIGIRHSSMLPQMFQPRFDKEGFQEAARVRGILEHAPRIGSVASALMSQSCHRGEKYFAILRSNPVLDSYHDRTRVVRNPLRDD